MNQKVEVESSISHVSLKRLVSGGLSLDFIGSTCTAVPRRCAAGTRRTRGWGPPASAAYGPTRNYSPSHLHVRRELDVYQYSCPLRPALVICSVNCCCVPQPLFTAVRVGGAREPLVEVSTHRVNHTCLQCIEHVGSFPSKVWNRSVNPSGSVSEEGGRDTQLAVEVKRELKFKTARKTLPRGAHQCLAGAARALGRLLGSHLGVAAQVELELESRTGRQCITLQFQALSSRRFQPAVHRFNLHRLTSGAAAPPSPSLSDPCSEPWSTGAFTKGAVRADRDRGPRAYTRPLSGSTLAVSDTKTNPPSPYHHLTPPK